MKKYILTAEGMKEANKLKVSTTHREAGLSRGTIDIARKTGIFSENTLTTFFKKNIVNFTEGVHYIQRKPNMVICVICGNEVHNTYPHTCYDKNDL